MSAPATGQSNREIEPWRSTFSIVQLENPFARLPTPTGGQNERPAQDRDISTETGTTQSRPADDSSPREGVQYYQILHRQDEVRSLAPVPSFPSVLDLLHGDDHGPDPDHLFSNPDTIINLHFQSFVPARNQWKSVIFHLQELLRSYPVLPPHPHPDTHTHPLFDPVNLAESGWYSAGPLVNSDVYFVAVTPVDRLVLARGCAGWRERFVPSAALDAGLPGFGIHALLLLRILHELLVVIQDLEDQARKMCSFLKTVREPHHQHRDRAGGAGMEYPAAAAAAVVETGLLPAWRKLAKRLGNVLCLRQERVAVVVESVARERAVVKAKMEQDEEEQQNPDPIDVALDKWMGAFEKNVVRIRDDLVADAPPIVEGVKAVNGILNLLCEQARESAA